MWGGGGLRGKTTWSKTTMGRGAVQALDGNFVKILYFIKCQSVLYLSVKFQVNWPQNKEVTIYPTALS